MNRPHSPCPFSMLTVTLAPHFSYFVLGCSSFTVLCWCRVYSRGSVVRISFSRFFSHLGYVFILAALASCSVWLLLAVVRGLPLQWFLCCGAAALGARASVVVAKGLSCSGTCGILPDQGSDLCPLPWQADSCPLHHQGSPHVGHCRVLSRVLCAVQKVLVDYLLM